MADSVKNKEVLYKSFYGYVKGVVIRYVQDVQNVEELVNDSFIKIFNNLSSFKAVDNHVADINKAFRGWASKIASRTAIDFLRKKRNHFSFSDDAGVGTTLAYSATAGYSSEAKDILKLLNHLPETQKMIFNLYEIEGFSHEEISGFLAISESVSRSYLSRAKTRLKSLYVKNFN